MWTFGNMGSSVKGGVLKKLNRKDKRPVNVRKQELIEQDEELQNHILDRLQEQYEQYQEHNYIKSWCSLEEIITQWIMDHILLIKFY